VPGPERGERRGGDYDAMPPAGQAVGGGLSVVEDNGGRTLSPATA